MASSSSLRKRRKPWRFRPVLVINCFLIAVVLLYFSLEFASGFADQFGKVVQKVPELLKVECDRRTATIRWKPLDGASVLYYDIQFNTSFTPDTWNMAFEKVPATQSAFTVSMSPWANYSFRVVAVPINRLEPSIPSGHSSVCSTKPDVPNKHPEDVRGYGSTPSNLVISWTVMPEIDHNAPNFMYIVHWKFDDNISPWQIRNITDWRRSFLVIEKQPTYNPYKIQVRAANELGEANLSVEEITGYSGMYDPKEKPENFTLLEIKDARTAVFSWDPVDPKSLRGKFEGYKIQTWTDYDGDDDRRELLIENNVTQAVVDKLIPFSKNYVVVLAYNTDYDGPSSRIVEVMTEESTPGPVDAFDAYPLGASALYLEWRKPEQPNGILTGYEISYQKVIGTEVGVLVDRKPPIMDPETTDAKLVGLESGTKYRIHIKGTTRIGPGKDNFIERSTEQEGQTTPLNKPKFDWAQITTYSNLTAAILVKWVPNKEGPGRAGSHFFVQYKRPGDIKYKSTEPEFYNLNTTVRGLQPGETYVFRVVSVDGDKQTISDPEEIYTDPSDIVQAKPGSETTGWFIGLIVAIVLIALVLILICIVKRNRGGKYNVYEREMAHGHLDCAEGSFREYSQPVEERSGRMSIGSDFKPPHESDRDSKGEYGDEAKFAEDASFIGQYEVKKKPDPNLPSPMTTFV